MEIFSQEANFYFDFVLKQNWSKLTLIILL